MHAHIHDVFLLLWLFSLYSSYSSTIVQVPP